MNTASPIVPAPGFLRHAPLWLLASLLACGGFIVCLLLGMQHGSGPRLISMAFFSVMYLGAAWGMSRAARRPDLPVRVRNGLRFFTVGLLLNGLGALYLLIERTVSSSPGYFSGADAIFLLAYPVFLFFLGTMPAGDRPVAGRWRILIDGAVFAVGFGVPLWVFALQPQLRQASGFEAALLVIWPFAALCGIFAVNAALLTRAPQPTRAALILALTGFGVSCLADLIFSLDAAERIIVRSSINWINVTNAASLSLYLLAIWRFQTDPMPSRPANQPAAFSPVPLFTIVAVTAWLILLAATRQSNPVSVEQILPGLILLFIMLLVRETLVMRDSQRWMAVEAQRASQARFEAMVRNSSDVIMIVDQDRRIRFASPAAFTMLGVAPEALLGQDLVALAHPEDAAAGAGFVDELRLHPGATRHLHWRLRSGDGAFRHLETAGSNLLLESTIEGLVLNSRDVSERLELEERLHRAAKMEAIGRLAGGVAHDFNNLLTVIMANSELALMDLPADHPVRRDIEEVRRATTRGTTLTGRLLSITQSENLQPRVISPGEVLKNLLPLLERQVGPGLSVSIEAEAGGGMVKVNPDAFEQALLNLAANARDASLTGGKLTFTVRSVMLNEPLASAYLTAPRGRYVVIEAADTGAGMDELTRSKLFEPFFTTKERGRGTGLGLASIYGTVKTAGGGITVQTQPGQGTVIGLWFPEVTPGPAVAASGSGPASAVGGTETILLVEDEDLVRQATQRILVAKGYRVLAASDASDARRVLQAHTGPVELLLTDVMMPGQTGPVLAADLVKQRPDLRVLYMSGYTGNELGLHGLTNADARLLVKPFSVDQLTSRLRQVMAGPAGKA